MSERGSVARVGRRTLHGGTPRRSTPIPVPPPRVPTPMPPPGEAEQKIAEQIWRPRKTGQKTNPIKYMNRAGKENTPWINPRLIQQMSSEPIDIDDLNDLHHSETLLGAEGKRKHGGKDRGSVEGSKRRLRFPWFGRDRPGTSSVAPDRAKVVNPVVGERVCRRGLSSATEDNRFTYYGFLEPEVTSVVSSQAVLLQNVKPVEVKTSTVDIDTDNTVTDVVPIKVRNHGYPSSSEDDHCELPIRTFKSVKREIAIENAPKIPKHEMATNETKVNTIVSNNRKCETVYENINYITKDKPNEFKKLETSNWKAASEMGRNKPKKWNNSEQSICKPEPYPRISEHVENFDSTLEGFYRAGMINGSSFDEFSGINRGIYTESKYAYSVSVLPGSAAQASAAAAFFARAAQKLNLSSPHRRKRHAAVEDDPDTSRGFFGALHRYPPAMPPVLSRRIGAREVTGIGKVKVMLRVTGRSPPADSPQFFTVDGRKKQVTLLDPSICGAPPAPEDRRVGVTAPKMFAFDAIFTPEDSQTDICTNALTDVIHAVINGTDGCLFCFGHARLGKTATMIGSPESSNSLGVIPCAISWLFRGIHEQKQKTGARFSVRVSAVEVCPPSQTLKDLLAGHANDCEQSPGVYLRDDPLFGTQLQNQSELRVPTAEKAAFYLDAALASRSLKDEGKDSHFLYTLHVYQYSVAGRGGVAGGRSRLHLIDLGSCDRGKVGGGIPLSGIGNVLLAIFNGQKHLPYREQKITQLLKECLGSLTCHAAMIAHVSQTAVNYIDTLTTVQLASRIHRMRRRKFKFGTPPSLNPATSEELARQATSTGSSDVDPSSSEQSADTVIYVGPADDAATDGEHPPVYIPSMNSGDNRCVMSKALRGSSVEMRPNSRIKHSSPAKSVGHRPAEASPAKVKPGINSAKSSPARTCKTVGVKNEESSKTVASHSAQANRHEEQWIDGPRISKQKVAEARNILLKEHIKKETWIDGPMQKPSTATTNTTSKPSGNSQACGSYGFMDSHKKSMIRKWVENQTVQLKQPSKEQSGISRSSEPADEPYKQLTSFKTVSDEVDQLRGDAEGIAGEVACLPVDNSATVPGNQVTVARAVIKQTDACFKNLQGVDIGVCGGSSESSEEEKLPPPPLPLLLRYGSDHKMDVQSLSRMSLPEGMDEYEDEEIELEIVEISETEEPVPMQDSCLQVTEEDIAFCMGESENPLPEVDQEEHPLRVLSQENLTVVSTFTDSLSATHDMERSSLPRPRYGPSSLFDLPYCSSNGGETFHHDDYIEVLSRSKLGSEPLEQLARLHQLYRSKLAMTTADRNGKCQSLSLSDMLNLGETEGVINGNSSIYSEPPYRVPDDTSSSICNSCRQNINPEESMTRLNFQSLRHPDGASNPNLDEGQLRRQRVPGNGASKSDYEEESSPRPITKKRTNSETRKTENCSPSRKSHQNTREHDPGKITENGKIHQGSPARRAGGGKTKGIETLDFTQVSDKVVSSANSPLTQKHLYLNKTCNEGYDSGHDSTTSPKTPKLPRARTQAQCESSGYESVVSFNSSLDSEIGVKLLKEDPEEIHDPGGHSAWWCWCVSGPPSASGRATRRAPRRGPPHSPRAPLTVPPAAPTSARSQDKRPVSHTPPLPAIDSRGQKDDL